jgi:hypothetical protein
MVCASYTVLTRQPLPIPRGNQYPPTRLLISSYFFLVVRGAWGYDDGVGGFPGVFAFLFLFLLFLWFVSV